MVEVYLGENTIYTCIIVRTSCVTVCHACVNIALDKSGPTAADSSTLFLFGPFSSVLRVKSNASRNTLSRSLAARGSNGNSITLCLNSLEGYFRLSMGEELLQHSFSFSGMFLKSHIKGSTGVPHIYGMEAIYLYTFWTHKSMYKPSFLVLSSSMFFSATTTLNSLESLLKIFIINFTINSPFRSAYLFCSASPLHALLCTT